MAVVFIFLWHNFLSPAPPSFSLLLWNLPSPFGCLPLCHCIKENLSRAILITHFYIYIFYCFRSSSCPYPLSGSSCNANTRKQRAKLLNYSISRWNGKQEIREGRREEGVVIVTVTSWNLYPMEYSCTLLKPTKTVWMEILGLPLATSILRDFIYPQSPVFLKSHFFDHCQTLTSSPAPNPSSNRLSPTFIQSAAPLRYPTTTILFSALALSKLRSLIFRIILDTFISDTLVH